MTARLRVGLTGGIGCGKSEVARMLSACGAVVIDADALAREAVAPGTSGLGKVVAEFGPEILDRHGALDRAGLAKIVFADQARLRRLEAIVHPLVSAAAAAREADAPAGSIVVHEQPLLVETRLAAAGAPGEHDLRRGSFDVVVVVDCSPQTQMERLLRVRGMAEDEARARITSQASREERLAAATVVLGNDGTRQELREQVLALYDRLVTWPDASDRPGGQS